MYGEDKNDTICALKTVVDDFEVEYELIPMLDINSLKEVDSSNSNQETKAIEALIEEKQKEISVLNESIDRLTNTTDVIDCAIAVTCGLITGIIDAGFVGEWNFKEAKAMSNEEINIKVIEFAKKDPRYADYIANKRHSNSDLENAITFLENKYKLPGDGAYKEFKSFGITDSTHHLDDFSHHPTLIGLICSILVQFTGEAKYLCATGKVIQTTIQVNEYGNLVSSESWGKVFSGVINWFFNIAKTAQNRKGHLFSDMAGSSTSAGKGNDGAGLPGVFLSTLKELSALPCFKDSEFGENLRKAFENGIGTGKKQLDLGPFNSLFEGASSKLDMRTEKAVGKELKRQAFPVVLNEILVRASYFVRRFISQMKEKKSILDLDWKETLPVQNRTITRMLTIASGTFMVVDLADATLHSAIKSVSCNPNFLSNMVLRINFVGVGRFAIAVAKDSAMEIQCEKVRNERMQLINEQIVLYGAKIYYKQSNLWIAANNTGEAINDMCEKMEQAITSYADAINEIDLNLNTAKMKLSIIAKNNSRKTKQSLKLLRR